MINKRDLTKKDLDKKINGVQEEILNAINLPLFKPFKYPIVLKERYNIKKANLILKNPDKVKSQFKKKNLFKTNIYHPIKTLKKYMNKFPNGVAIVKYKKFSDKAPHLGRLTSTVHPSIQNIPRQIKHTICRDYYIELDTYNAYATYLNWLCKILKIKKRTYLDEYVKNRENILSDLQKINKTKSLQDIKDIFIHMISGGFRKYYSLKNKNKFIKNFFREIKDIQKKLCSYFPKTYSYIKIWKQTTKNPKNISGSLVDIFLTTIEDHILMIICYYLKKRKVLFNETVLQYDGLLLKKSSKKLTNKLLRDMEKFIFDKTTISVKLTYKEMNDHITF